MHGAAEASLATATASVRAELAVAAPAPDRLLLVAPAAHLAEDLLSLARRVAGVAAQGIARLRLYEGFGPLAVVWSVPVSLHRIE